MKIELMSLDVGDARIGVALGESGVRIAVPYRTLEVDGHEIAHIFGAIEAKKIRILVVGRPIDQKGRETEQTEKTDAFVQRMVEYHAAHTEVPDFELVFWGESGTSILAEDILKKAKRNYSKGDIDMQAAAVILQDFMESRRFFDLVKKVEKRLGKV
ncbi:MAG: Holliday junction resolvase RuvX [Candidatus Nomurabacteria bacterium]|jgi:putative Holliday junction resolvase|nr:Holliday junction resolvase RuvX [Candidatus Nomurabacteria bacterium]